jgi:hypothetical protein
MFRMKQALLAAAGFGALLAAGAARANVIYTFNTTSMSATLGTIPPAGLPLTATLDLTDAQVATGSFVLGSPGGVNGPGPVFTGDVGGFSSIVVRGEQITPSYLYGDIAADFTFDPEGDVTSSDLRFAGISEAAQVSGTGSSASGYVGSDSGTCTLGFAPAVPTTRPGQCSVSGYWSVSETTNAVPEPISLALLCSGLVGVMFSGALVRGGGRVA